MLFLNPGDMVGIPCDVARGAFPDEYLVTFESVTGLVSGFVRRSEIIEEGGEKMLRGVVIELDDQNVVVRVAGSFFTTTGLAYLARDWAASNLRPVG